MTQKPRRLNFYAGPGTGKSTTAADVFRFCKQLGVNIELVTEFAKDATWEGRGATVFRAQDYLFGKQHFRLQRMHEKVDFIVTDSPILMSDVYTKLYHGDTYALPSLRKVFREAHAVAENIDIFLIRNKPYNPNGRNQDEPEARNLDRLIRELLDEEVPGAIYMDYGRACVDDVAQVLIDKGWMSDFTDAQLNELIEYHAAALSRYSRKLEARA